MRLRLFLGEGDTDAGVRASAFAETVLSVSDMTPRWLSPSNIVVSTNP